MNKIILKLKQKQQNKALIQGTSKDVIDFVFCQLSTSGHGTVKNSCFPQRNFLEGNKIFICYR